MRLWVGVLTLPVALLALEFDAGRAQAAVVTYVNPIVTVDAGADGGVRNEIVVIRPDPGSVQIRDTSGTAPLITESSPDCVVEPSGAGDPATRTITCTANVLVVQALGGPGNDDLRYDPASAGPAVNVDLRGGPGSDNLIGGPGEDVIDGDDGAGDTLAGGAGADFIHDSGLDGGPDFVNYDDGAHTSSGTVLIDLRGGIGQGDPNVDGAGDTLGTDIELLVGSPGRDEVHGNDADNQLRLGEGDDLVFGLGGGTDLVFADGGDDEVFAQNDKKDTIYGGPGDDTATADPGVDVVSEFEHVTPAGPGPGPGPTPDPPVTTGCPRAVDLATQPRVPEFLIGDFLEEQGGLEITLPGAGYQASLYLMNPGTRRLSETTPRFASASTTSAGAGVFRLRPKLSRSQVTQLVKASGKRDLELTALVVVTPPNGCPAIAASDEIVLDAEDDDSRKDRRAVGPAAFAMPLGGTSVPRATTEDGNLQPIEVLRRDGTTVTVPLFCIFDRADPPASACAPMYGGGGPPEDPPECQPIASMGPFNMRSECWKYDDNKETATSAGTVVLNSGQTITPTSGPLRINFKTGLLTATRARVGAGGYLVHEGPINDWIADGELDLKFGKATARTQSGTRAIAEQQLTDLRESGWIPGNAVVTAGAGGLTTKVRLGFKPPLSTFAKGQAELVVSPIGRATLSLPRFELPGGIAVPAQSAVLLNNALAKVPLGKIGLPGKAGATLPSISAGLTITGDKLAASASVQNVNKPLGTPYLVLDKVQVAMETFRLDNSFELRGGGDFTVGPKVAGKMLGKIEAEVVLAFPPARPVLELRGKLTSFGLTLADGKVKLETATGRIGVEGNAGITVAGYGAKLKVVSADIAADPARITYSGTLTLPGLDPSAGTVELVRSGTNYFLTGCITAGSGKGRGFAMFLNDLTAREVPCAATVIPRPRAGNRSRAAGDDVPTVDAAAKVTGGAMLKGRFTAKATGAAGSMIAYYEKDAAGEVTFIADARGNQSVAQSFEPRAGGRPGETRTIEAVVTAADGVVLAVAPVATFKLPKETKLPAPKVSIALKKGKPTSASWPIVAGAGGGYHVQIRYSDGRVTDTETKPSKRTVTLFGVDPQEKVTVTVRAIDGDDEDGLAGTASVGSKQRAKKKLAVAPNRLGVAELVF